MNIWTHKKDALFPTFTNGYGHAKDIEKHRKSYIFPLKKGGRKSKSTGFAGINFVIQ